MSSTKSQTSSTHKDPIPPGNPKSSLSAEDLCRIIKACRESGVSELKFGELHAVFRQQTDEVRAPSLARRDRMSELVEMERRLRAHSTRPPAPAAAIAANQAKEAKRALEEDETKLKNEELAELYLTNPKLAEEMLNQGELEDDEQTEYA